MIEYQVELQDLEGCDWFNIQNCPMARCLKRHFPNSNIKVGFFNANIDEIHYKIVCSIQAHEVIIAIDKKTPFTFKMEKRYDVKK